VFGLPSIRLSMPRTSIGNALVTAKTRVANFVGGMKETIGNYIEVIVLLVLAPTILAFWASFRNSITDTNLQSVIDALTIVVVLGIAMAAITKVTSD